MTTAHDKMTLLAEISDAVARLTVGWTDTVITAAADPDDRPNDTTTVKGTIAFAGLITQLYESLEGGAGADYDIAHLKPVPDSKPPVADEPFDVLMAIDQFEKTAPAPWHGLVGWAAGQTDDHVVTALALELTALIRRADIALGFAHAPRQLKGKCPVCYEPDKVYADMTDDGPTGARCRACGSVWDTPVLELLARALEVP